MLEYSKWLSGEISKVTDEMVANNEPKKEPKKNEKEVAVLNDDERRAWVVMCGISNRNRDLAIAHNLKHLYNQGADMEKECAQFWSDSFRFFKESQMVRDVITQSVRMRIPYTTKVLKVRKGWKVVAGEEELGGVKIELKMMLGNTEGFPPHMCN